jgi:hypothetical protein
MQHIQWHTSNKYKSKKLILKISKTGKLSTDNKIASTDKVSTDNVNVPDKWYVKYLKWIGL